MAVSVLRPVIEPGSRTIIIADLNGNDEAFTRLLAKIGYTKKDTLFILGNLVEETGQSSYASPCHGTGQLQSRLYGSRKP